MNSSINYIAFRHIAIPAIMQQRSMMYTLILPATNSMNGRTKCLMSWSISAARTKYPSAFQGGLPSASAPKFKHVFSLIGFPLQ